MMNAMPMMTRMRMGRGASDTGGAGSMIGGPGGTQLGGASAGGGAVRTATGSSGVARRTGGWDWGRALWLRLFGGVVKVFA